jgi:hypothetical protein
VKDDNSIPSHPLAVESKKNAKEEKKEEAEPKKSKKKKEKPIEEGTAYYIGPLISLEDKPHRNAEKGSKF